MSVQTGDALDAAGWFSDVAWNVAVHGGDMDPADRSRLFSLSRLFLEFDLRNNQAWNGEVIKCDIPPLAVN